MFEVTVLAAFEAAHCLPAHPGKCARLHGHNWQVEVTLAGEQLDDAGMLVDFHAVKEKVASVLATLDHYYLNELPAWRERPPTAENLARYIYTELKPQFAEPRVRLKHVKVWESPQAAALYREGT